jgi:hypothetical protein
MTSQQLGNSTLASSACSLIVYCKPPSSPSPVDKTVQICGLRRYNTSQNVGYRILFSLPIHTSDQEGADKEAWSLLPAGFCTLARYSLPSRTASFTYMWYAGTQDVALQSSDGVGKIDFYHIM